MALKAGRVGVAKDQVDEFGKIIGGGSPSGDYYTKTQADNKFETKTHVNNTFQKKTLDVPIEMLSGTKLTVEEALNGLNDEKFEKAEQRVLGAKNFLPYLVKSGVENGITYNENKDGVSLNGTASAQFRLRYRENVILPTGDYIISHGVTGVANDTYFLNISPSPVTPENPESGYDILTDEYQFHADGNTAFSFFIYIRSGVTVSNLTFCPMIRLASDPDDVFVPYAMTNSKLTEELSNIDTGVTSELTLNTLTTAVHSGAGNKIVRLGNVVTLCTALDVHSLSEWTTAIATVPEGFRPPYRMRFPCLKGINAFSIDIKSDGSIVLPEGVGSTAVELWISISYLVND